MYNFEYEEALENDRRTFWRSYFSLMKLKELIYYTFFLKDDYNSIIIKICLFLFSFSLYYTVNSLFFTDSTIHEIYEDKGLSNIINQIPEIIYSMLISSTINSIVRFFSLTEKDIINTKKINERNLKNLLKFLKIKFIFFYIFDLLFLILFWYYLACFCAIYKNSQYYLIKDTLICFGLSLLYPFGFNLLPGIFRIPSLNGNKRKRECLYKTSTIIQII